MKRLIKYTGRLLGLFLTSISSFLLISSCEEVIEIDLNSSNPVIVAEGSLYEDSLALIQLSYTSDYFHAEDPVLIEDAQVFLSDENGNSENLLHIGNGYYQGTDLIGNDKTDYTLSFEIDGVEYEGETRLLPKPELVNIFWAESFFQVPGPPGTEPVKNYNVTFNLLDDPSEDNHYLLKFTHNSEPQMGFNLLTSDDFVSDEGYISFTTFMFQFNLGDTVGIHVQSIDEDAYWFYNQMNDAGSGGPSGMSTPYNPYSNFGEGVLGYFMARSKIDTVVYIREIPGF